MNATVTNVGDLIRNAAEEFSSLPENYMDAAVIEVNAVQELYFMRFASVPEEVAMLVPPNGVLDLSVAESMHGVTLRADRILCVFADDTLLPILPYEEFRKTAGYACALSNETLLFRCPRPCEHIRPVYRYVPQPAVLSGGSVVGSVYIPRRHLPMLVYKLRQTMCALAGEYDAADYYARAYNAFIEKLAGEEAKRPAASGTL